METKHTHPEMLEALNEAKRTICSLKLSLLAHPDCTEGSEFDDMTTRAQEMEDEISSLLKKNTGGGEMKNIDQIKEDLAHEYGFKTWREMFLYTDMPGDLLIDKVAEYYAIEVIRAAAYKFNYRSEAWKTIMDTIKELK